MIEGVQFKELVTHTDKRGFFREIIRQTDDPFFNVPFGQWSHSFIYDGVIKAWHYHKIQTDYFYVVSGVLRVGLCDLREDSPTFKQVMDFQMGDFQKASCVKIPPGIAHGVKCIQGPCNLLYMMSHIYNPDDEIRIPYNSKDIEFNWHDDYEIT
ncbi:MAG: dTDP-4-dehydrorhamnose 3,5-epimerase family protein [Halobacteriovoraceae bacterium]|nr:dTDP-4-dehydrorhamnose 3,5-epimerase family protein [Halobacteriovoraceae bacterium]